MVQRTEKKFQTTLILVFEAIVQQSKIQCTSDMIFPISADTDNHQLTQFSYWPIPINY